MGPATNVTEFGTGLRAHLGLDHDADPQAEIGEPEEPSLEPPYEDIDVLALLEAELIERERQVSTREAALAERGGSTGVDEIGLARERRRARTSA